MHDFHRHLRLLGKNSPPISTQKNSSPILQGRNFWQNLLWEHFWQNFYGRKNVRLYAWIHSLYLYRPTAGGSHGFWFPGYAFPMGWCFVPLLKNSGRLPNNMTGPSSQRFQPNCLRLWKTAFISGVGVIHRVRYVWTKGSQLIKARHEPGLFILPMWVTTLQGGSSGRHYCGQTSDVDRRLRQHNSPAYQLSKTAKRFEGPWKHVWVQECIDRSEATELERLIKRKGIERYLNDLNQ